MAAHIWHQLNPLGGGWLPEHVTVRGRKRGTTGVLGELVVSECWRAGGEEGEALWVASADGKGVGVEEDVMLAVAKEKAEGAQEEVEVERAYELMAVVSFVASGGQTAADSQGSCMCGGRGRLVSSLPFQPTSHHCHHHHDNRRPPPPPCQGA